MDNKAYQKMDYALCLLSAAADGRNHGCIVNSFHQVTSSFPPKFTVAVNKDHETCKAVQAAGSFSVTLLDADAPAELIDTFGYKSGRVADKFAGREVQTDGSGNPYLKEHMVSRIACKVVDRLEIGSYILFVGQAAEAEVLGDGKVLTLQAYTDRGKATPPTSTVPVSASQNRGIRLAAVVLPPPEGPTSATVSPGSAVKETWDRAGDCAPS